jgi:uncharacterized membrane protein YphA (DoxX/SURF4 family)
VILSRYLFAVASASLAILSLVYGDSGLIGQSVPAWVPGREAWVYGSALLLLIAGGGLCFSRVAPLSALTIGAYLAIWALTCTPQIVSKPLSVEGWYGFCEALTSIVGAWILYSMLRGQWGGSRLLSADDRLAHVARILFGLTCVFYGWSHFVYAEYTASMVPVWLPGHLGFAYFTGLAHIAAGVGIIVGILPRLAATLEAIMMSLFGLLVWVPSFFAQPRPKWAALPQSQWSELVVNLLLAAAAWIVATSLADRSWAFDSRPRARSSQIG